MIPPPKMDLKVHEYPPPLFWIETKRVVPMAPLCNLITATTGREGYGRTRTGKDRIFWIFC